MNRNYLIDIGATYTRFGVSSNRIVEPLFIKKTPNTQKEILMMLEVSSKELMAKIDVINNSLVVSCPGLIDAQGKINDAYYIDLKGVSLKDYFLSTIKEYKDVIVWNDANIQAIGQYNSKNLLYIVIGSAVGGAYVDKNGIFKGQNGYACEFGHLPVIDSNNTTRIAYLDDIISGITMIKRFGTKWWTLENKKEIREYITYSGTMLSTVIENLVMVLDPGEICICGHICKHSSFKSTIQRCLSHICHDRPIIFKTNTWELINKACFKLL